MMAQINQVPPPMTSTDKDLPWLQDVNRAAQILTGLSLGSSAQAALITRDEVLWAYAGQLPQETATELGETLARYWDNKGQDDLVRFIRLETTSAEHMMYATRLAKGMVLSLVFDAETPFSTIRSQTGQFARSLSALPSEEEAIDEEKDQEQDESQPLNLEALSSILSDVPSPNPDQDLHSGQVETQNYALNPSIEASPAPLENQSDQESNPTISVGPFSYTIPLDEGEKDNPRATPISATGRRVIFEPTTQALYNLNYACLMIPRFPTHYLTGDLANRLSEWVPKLCIAFAWRLEHLSVCPDYLQWIVNVSPTTAPGYLMRIMRKHMSEKIFADFPRLADDNPSRDFWANGYVLMGGTNPHPAQLVKDFIQQTRLHQGIS
jgi:REP element-mobilizing transposase RayT